MALDKITKQAITIGQDRAKEALGRRAAVARKRKQMLARHPKAMEQSIQRLAYLAAPPTKPLVLRTAGVLVAEGDSWFDYPLHDVLKELEDRYGYDVESVAHKGDPIEEMAYGDGQLDDLIRRIEKLQARGTEPRAILLSGGGNDVAGKEFGMLLNHAHSAIAGLNQDIVQGLIEGRIRTAYMTILSALIQVCETKYRHRIPILVHGYDFPVPDGRGFLGGWWLLPGPWLEPGFREKGFEDLNRRILLARDLINQFNAMLVGVTALSMYQQDIHFVDLRGTLSAGSDYRSWWANELHPTHRGFSEVAQKFETVLNGLP